MTKYLAALTCYKSLLNTYIKTANGSVALTQTNLQRNFEQKDLDRARSHIWALTKYQLQRTAHNKIMGDVQAVESNLSAVSKKSVLKDPALAAALWRLQEAAKISRNKDMKAAICCFPQPKAQGFILPPEFSVLLAAAEPAMPNIAAFLPAIAQETRVPVDFLEAAVGITATYNVAPDPGLFGTGQTLEAETEVFPTVEPRFGWQHMQ
jgi:hypothetical protein